MPKVLVIVHGAGKQLPNYADDLVAQIALLLGEEPQAVPVYYADICNIGSPLEVGAEASGEPAPPPPEPEPPQVTQFKAAFMMEVQADVDARRAQDRAAGGTPSAGPDSAAGNGSVSPAASDAAVVAASAFSPQFLADLLATEVNEIARYLFEADTYVKIQARMCDGLEAANQLGDSLVVASHSLGSVVAFDALRAIANHYNVATFYTLGSPLAKLRRLGNRTADLGALSRPHVLSWENWYDTTDPVSNVLGPSFPAKGYRLRDVFVDNGPALPSSHDYFGSAEVLAAIAEALR